MFDQNLRGLKDRLLAPLVGLLGSVHPLWITLAGVLAGLGAALCAAWGQPLPGLALWLLNRLLDGLDGLVARASGKTSDLGGYLDLVADFAVYAAIPLGLAWHDGSAAVWMAAAFLLGTYYLNSLSWLGIAVLQAGSRGQAGRPTTPGAGGVKTSMPMPRGLMEGFETIVLYVLFFVMGPWLPALMWTGAGLVAVSALARLLWACRGGLGRVGDGG